MTTLNNFADLDAVEFEVSEEAVSDWYSAEPKVQQAWQSPLPNMGGTLTQAAGHDSGF